jgi:ABC-type glutathione transport system ATPase component
MGSDLQTQPTSSLPFVRVKGLSKSYVRGGVWRRRVRVVAVENADFEIPLGKTLALVGESGSGKSTVARCIARLEKPDAGEILVDDAGRAPTGSQASSWRSLVQMVFQDPATSMNPRFTAFQAVEEPLLIDGHDASRLEQTVRAAMHAVGLSTDWINRPVLEFSGGQKQKLAIARALILRPKLLVLDEALSGLDLSTQAQIANLLLDLQSAQSLTYLLISHDLSLVARMADEIAVMSRGRIVEKGPAVKILTAPEHEETVRLVSAAEGARKNLALATGASA